MWARATIPWSLECEAQGKTRQLAYDSIVASPPTDVTYLLQIVLGAVLVICFTLFCGCANCMLAIVPAGVLSLIGSVVQPCITLGCGYLTWYGAQHF
jgi:hypothetical protein